VERYTYDPYGRVLVEHWDDDAGNLKDDGVHLFDYDAENRLTRVRRKSDSQTLGEYGYNALGWRTKKVVTNSGALNGVYRLVYNSAWQLLETRVVSGQLTTTNRQFIHAGAGVPGSMGVSPVNQPYIDDHVAMLTPDGETWTAHYYHTDEMFNTLALSDDDGEVAERADFDPYGTATLKDGSGTPISTSAIGNPFLRQGVIRDWETHNDDNRHRWYTPTLGRWSQRDPLFTNGRGSEGVSSGLQRGSVEICPYPETPIDNDQRTTWPTGDEPTPQERPIPRRPQNRNLVLALEAAPLASRDPYGTCSNGVTLPRVTYTQLCHVGWCYSTSRICTVSDQCVCGRWMRRTVCTSCSLNPRPPSDPTPPPNACCNVANGNPWPGDCSQCCEFLINHPLMMAFLSFIFGIAGLPPGFEQMSVPLCTQLLDCAGA
jgi:RHS repeat-associated protein